MMSTQIASLNIASDSSLLNRIQPEPTQVRNDYNAQAYGQQGWPSNQGKPADLFILREPA